MNCVLALLIGAVLIGSGMALKCVVDSKFENPSDLHIVQLSDNQNSQVAFCDTPKSLSICHANLVCVSETIISSKSQNDDNDDDDSDQNDDDSSDDSDNDRRFRAARQLFQHHRASKSMHNSHKGAQPIYPKYDYGCALVNRSKIPADDESAQFVCIATEQSSDGMRSPGKVKYLVTVVCQYDYCNRNVDVKKVCGKSNTIFLKANDADDVIVKANDTQCGGPNTPCKSTCADCQPDLYCDPVFHSCQIPLGAPCQIDSQCGGEPTSCCHGKCSVRLEGAAVQETVIGEPCKSDSDCCATNVSCCDGRCTATPMCEVADTCVPNVGGGSFCGPQTNSGILCQGKHQCPPSHHMSTTPAHEHHTSTEHEKKTTEEDRKTTEDHRKTTTEEEKKTTEHEKTTTAEEKKTTEEEKKTTEKEKTTTETEEKKTTTEEEKKTTTEEEKKTTEKEGEKTTTPSKKIKEVV